MKILLMSVASVLFGVVGPLLSARGGENLVLIGTDRSGAGVGFSLARFDPDTGALSRPEFIEEAQAPSFFVMHPDGKHVYTCNSINTYQGKPEGSISAYAIDSKTGRLTLLNRKP